MIRLALVDKTTFEDVVNVKISQSDNRKVASVEYSLAQAWLYSRYSRLEPLAILSSKEVVGFLLLSIENEGEVYHIWRLLVDKAHQNRGYGQEAIKQVITRASQDKDCSRVVVGYVIGNHKMRSILEKLGFQPLGMVGNEIKMTLNVK